MSKDPQIKPKRPLWQHLGLGALSIALAGLLLLVSGYFYLESDAGKKQLVSWVNSRLSDDQGGVVLGSIDGSPFGDFTLSALSVADGNGVWLDIDHVQVKWSPIRLLTGRVDISRLNATALRLYRLPKARDTGGGGSAVPLDLNIDSFIVSDIRFGQHIDAATIPYQAYGSFDLSGKDYVVVRANLDPVGGDGDTIAIDIQYAGTGQNAKNGHDLSADIRLNAPQGGVFMSLFAVDLGHDLKVEMHGQGPIDNWSGVLNTSLGDRQVIDATVQRVNSIFTAQAALDSGVFADRIGSDPFGGPATLMVRAQPAEKAGGTDLTLSLGAKTMELSVHGILPKRGISADDSLDFMFTVKDANTLGRLTAPLTVRPFTITGSLRDLTGNAKLVASIEDLDVALDDRAAGRVRAKLEAVATAQAFDFRASGRLDQLAGSSLATLSSIVAPGFDWTLDGEISSLATAADFRLANGFLDIGGTGALGAESGALNTNIRATLYDISDLNLAASGTAKVTIDARRQDIQSPILADISVATDGVEFTNDLANEIISGTPSFAASLGYAEDGALDISSAQFAGKLVSIDATAAISPDRVITQAEYHIALSGLQNIKSLNNMALHGDINAAGIVSGPIASPSLTLEIGLRRLDVQNIEFHNVVAHLTADDIFPTVTGSVSIESETNLGDLSGQVAFSANEDAGYSLSSLDVALGPFHATGSLDVPADEPVTGAVTLVTEDAEPSLGGLRGVVTAQLNLRKEDGRQGLSLNGKLNKLEIPTGGGDLLTVEQGQLVAKILFEDKSPLITLDATLGGVAHPYIQASAARLNIANKNDALTYDVGLQGTKLMPYDLRLAGQTSTDFDAHRLISLAIEGTIDGSEIHTQAPLLFTLADGRYSLAPFKVNLGEGQIEGALQRMPDEIHATLASSKMNIQPLRLFIPDLPVIGFLDGALKFDATTSAVTGDFAFTLSSLGYGDEADILGPDFKISTSGVVTQDSIEFKGGAGGVESLDAQFTGHLPLTVDMGSARVSVPRDQPIDIAMDWRGEVEPFWPLLDLVNHDLRGQVGAKIHISGTQANPSVDGHFEMTNGRYESLRAGFVAADIDMFAQIADRKITLERFTANDGGSGLITAEGDVKLHPDFSYEAHAALHLSHARLIRQPEMDVSVTSSIYFVNDQSASKISGDVTVESADIGTITQGGPSIVDLEVVEINGDVQAPRQTAPTSTHLGPFDLDINFKAPGKLFIRSYGIESEWEADVTISGTTDAPKLDGNASLIRGVFEFSGIRFDLTKGVLRIPADGSNDPILDVTAEHEFSDFTAFIDITGRASAARLSVRSSPSMPQDEVISRILFGTSTTQLSALEAVQLAAAIHSLSQGGGSGLVGGMRRALGINRLSIDNSDDHEYGTTITGGKYLTDNIYVEVTTAPATGGAATSVEVRISKRLSVVTRRTLDADNSLSIRWSWVY